MPSVIYKYPLNDRLTEVLIPGGSADAIAVAMQGGEMFAWVIVDPTLPPASVLFHVFATGEVVARFPGRHVGTVHTQSGLVWHVWVERVGRST